MDMQNSASFKSRTWITAALLTASLICTALALTQKQKDAAAKCNLQYINCCEACKGSGTTDAFGDSYGPCADKCQLAYDVCLHDAGIPLKGHSPPILPRPTPGPAKSPSASPSKKPPGPGKGQIKSSPTASPAGPTLLSKPSKPTPTPHKEEHHRGHHG